MKLCFSIGIDVAGIEFLSTFCNIFKEDSLCSDDDVYEVSEGDGAIWVFFCFAPELFGDFQAEIMDACVSFANGVEGLLEERLGEG